MKKFLVLSMIGLSTFVYAKQNIDNSIQLHCPTGQDIKNASNHSVKTTWNQKTITWTINNPKHITPEEYWKPYVVPTSGVKNGEYRCKYLKLKLNTKISASVPATIMTAHTFRCPAQAINAEGQFDEKPLLFSNETTKKSALSKFTKAGLSGFYIGETGSELFLHIRPSIYRDLILNTTLPQKLICLYENGTIKTAELPALKKSHIYGAIGNGGQMQQAGELNEICIGDDCKNTE